MGRLFDELKRRSVVSVAIAYIVVGCVAPPAASEGDEVENLPTLIGGFAHVGVSKSLVATEAYVDMNDFYVRYENEDGEVYAGGQWAKRLDITRVEEQKDGMFEGPYILPIDYQQEERWLSIPEKPIRPRILSSEQWGRFLNSLLASVLPEDEKLGVVIHFDADDYFMYINEIGDIEARLHIDKPADYSVLDSLGFGEFRTLVGEVVFHDSSSLHASPT